MSHWNLDIGQFVPCVRGTVFIMTPSALAAREPRQRGELREVTSDQLVVQQDAVVYVE